MSIREGVRTSRRYQLRLSEPMSADLESFAASHGLALDAAIRLLVGRGLLAEAQGLGAAPVGESPATLAALVAAEHAVLMVASVLPEGQRRMRELDAQASAAAEQRLALFREEGE